MKQVQKKGLMVVLMLALLAGNLYISPGKAQAATQNEAVNWANAQIGKSLDYDHVYGCQCVDLIKYYYAYFGVANYAMGNANAYISNNLPAGWTRVYGNYQPGDIAVWKTNHSCNTCNTTSLGHVGIIISANGNGFNAVNQNFCNQSFCTKNWFNCSALACAIRPSYTNNAPAPSVTFADFSQNGVWETNAEMYIKIMNPNRRRVSAAGCYLYNADGGLVKSYSESCSYTTSYVNYNCNINNDMKYTLSPGTTYLFELYAIVDGKEYKDTRRSFTTKGNSDKERPVISDVSVYDVTETGYKVKCKATDNVGVVKVQFPTWTTANGQDDLQPNWWTNPKVSGVFSNGYWIFEVKSWEHNNELGEYITHIYAYDQAGNATCVAAPTTILKKNVVITPTPTPTPTKAPTQAPTAIPNYQDGNNVASVAEREYNTYHGQTYNYQYGSSPWCCNFVSWCARQAGISTDVVKSTATVQTMYDNLINVCGATVVSSPQRGDFVFYKYTDYDPQRFHHIGIMTSATESVQGNVNNTWWKGKPGALKNIKEMVYVRPAYNGKYVAPSTASFSDYRINQLKEDNAEVYIKIQNPNRENVTSVGCELYDENDVLLKSYTEDCNWFSSYVNYNCNFNSDMNYVLSPGTTYKFVLHAIVGGKRMNDIKRSLTTKGEKKQNMEQGSDSGEEETKSPIVTSVPIPTSTATTTPMPTAKATLVPTTTSVPKPTQTPKPVSIKRPSRVTGLLVSSSSRSIYASWNNGDVSRLTGFQVQYAKNSSFTKSCKTKTVGRFKTTIKVSKLKKKSTYYVRVRAVNRVGRITQYGDWCKGKKVKVK